MKIIYAILSQILSNVERSAPMDRQFNLNPMPRARLRFAARIGLDDWKGIQASRVRVHLFTGQLLNENEEVCTGKETALWEAYDLVPLDS